MDKLLPALINGKLQHLQQGLSSLIYNLLQVALRVCGVKPLPLPSSLDPKAVYLAFNSDGFLYGLFGRLYQYFGLGPASDFLHTQTVFFKDQQWQTVGLTPLGLTKEPLTNWLGFVKACGSKVTLVKLPLCMQINQTKLTQQANWLTAKGYSLPKAFAWLLELVLKRPITLPAIDQGHLCTDGAVNLISGGEHLTCGLPVRLLPKKLYQRAVQVSTANVINL
jgi:hypothetical protein